MASLFTRDFFQLARERLNAGGIYAQWFHCYQMDWPTLALVGRSFASVFPDSVMFSTEPSGSGRDFLLLGFKGEAGLALSRARQNLRFLKKSGNIRLPRAELFYRLLVTEDLKALFGPGPVHSRQNPVLEFAAPRHMYEGGRAKQTIMKKIRERREISPEKRRIIKRLESDVAAQIDYASFALSLYAPFSQMVDLSRADKRQRAEFQRIMTDYCRTNPVNYAIFRDEQLRRRCRRVQMQSIQNRLPDLPDPALSHAYLSIAHAASAQWDKSMETAESALSKARSAGRQKLAQTIDNHMRRLRLEGMLR